MNVFKKKIAKMCGYTLMEAIITLLVMGTISSIAVPSYVSYLEGTRSQEGVNIVATLVASQIRYHNEFGSYKSGSGTDGQLAQNDLDVFIPHGAGYPFYIYIYNDSTQVAEARRSSATAPYYTLRIDETGAIRCINGTKECSKYYNCAEITCGAGS